MKKKLIILSIVTILVPFALIAQEPTKTTIYANSISGNDATGDGTNENPYKTFFKAYTMASSGYTIDLTGTFDWTDADETGDTQFEGFLISKTNLTIQGQSPGSTFIQAASSLASSDRRIFRLNSNITFSLRNLTLRFGIAARTAYSGGTTTEGGAIGGTYPGTAFQDSQINLYNVTISDCGVWQGSSYDPDAFIIFTTGGILAENCAFVNNSSSTTDRINGIELYCGDFDHPIRTFKNCTFSNNQVGPYESLLMTDRDGANIVNCTFYNNTVGKAPLYCYGTANNSYMVFIYNTIIANTSQNGSSTAFCDLYIDGTGVNVYNSVAETYLGAPNYTSNFTTGSQSSLFLSATASSGGDNSLTPFHSITSASSTLQGTGAYTATIGNTYSGGATTVPTQDQRGFQRNTSNMDIGSFAYNYSPTNTTWTGTAGTSAWTTSSNWDNGTPINENFNAIIADATPYPIITSGVDATCNNLTVNSGATLTVESGGSLITNGTITNNGTINIEADYFFNTWNFLSSPVENALAGTFEGHFLQSWNEPTASWTEITATSQSLTPAKGYALYLSSGLKPPGMTLTYSGTPNTGNQSIALSYTNNGSGTKGANLVGNPYPSYLDWDVVTGYGSKYTWDGSAYNAYTAQGGFGTGSRYASPLEGFFVVTGSATTFTLNNTMRTHNSGKKASQGTSFQHGVVVAASNGNYSDALWVVFDQDASENFELERDAWKLLSPTNGISQMWSVSPDGPLAVDVRQETESIPLGFSNTLPGAYSITLQQMVGVTALFLEDTQTGTIHNFANGDYHFNYTLTDNPNRFKLLFGAIGTPETANATIRQWISGQTLYISAPTLAGQQVQVTVYSLTGQALQRQQVTLGEINAIALQGKQGAVVVETKSEDGSRVLTTKGIIIK